MAQASESIPDRIERYRLMGEEQNALVKALWEHCQTLEQRLAIAEADFQEESRNKREYREVAKTAAEAIQRKKFVVVLIDGDGYKFKSDFLMASGDDGGADAASALLAQVQQFLKLSNISPDVDVLVNVFANRLGLSKTLYDAGQLKSRDHFDQFFWSFGHQSLFHFIDCGYGKERADAKLRGGSHSSNIKESFPVLTNSL